MLKNKKESTIERTSLDKKSENEVNPKPYDFHEGQGFISNFDINQIHCPIKGPSIMKINENRINIEKLAVMEFDTFSETESFLVRRYIKEYI